MFWVFKDTETTGVNTRFDQVLQFAAVTCDDDFIEKDVIDMRCRLNCWTLPGPWALAVTKIDPESLHKHSMSQYEMISKLHKIYSGWVYRKTEVCIVTYNGLRFDEEIMRSQFWQNMYYPYLTSNSNVRRIDMLHVLRAIYARYPERIKTKTNEETGGPSFRLEEIAELNGINLVNAHDALADVRALKDVTMWIREEFPDIFQRFILSSDKSNARQMLHPGNFVKFVNSFQGHVEMPTMVSLCETPDDNNGVILLKADADIDALVKMSENDLYERWFAPFGCDETNDAYNARTEDNPFRKTAINKTPSVFPCATNQTGLEQSQQTRLYALAKNNEFVKKVQNCIQRKNATYKNIEIEEKIYEEFISFRSAEATAMKSFHNAVSWQEKYNIYLHKITNPKNKILALRIILDNASWLLPEPTRNNLQKAIVQRRFLRSSPDEITDPASGKSRWQKWNNFLSAFDDIKDMRQTGRFDNQFLDHLETWYKGRKKAAECHLREKTAELVC